jgi:hypothetical protein
MWFTLAALISLRKIFDLLLHINTRSGGFSGRCASRLVRVLVVSVAEENTQVDQVISLGVSIGISPAEQRVGALSQRLTEREQSADTPGTSDSPIRPLPRSTS